MCAGLWERVRICNVAEKKQTELALVLPNALEQAVKDDAT